MSKVVLREIPLLDTTPKLPSSLRWFTVARCRRYDHDDGLLLEAELKIATGTRDHVKTISRTSKREQ
jgi:hypothetical protein